MNSMEDHDEQGTEMKMHPKGIKNLVEGIVAMAIKDYMTWPPDNEMRKDAERFFLSEWYEILTGKSGLILKSQCDKLYCEKHRKKLNAWKAMEQQNSALRGVSDEEDDMEQIEM